APRGTGPKSTDRSVNRLSPQLAADAVAGNPATPSMTSDRPSTALLAPLGIMVASPATRKILGTHLAGLPRSINIMHRQDAFPRSNRGHPKGTPIPPRFRRVWPSIDEVSDRLAWLTYNVRNGRGGSANRSAGTSPRAEISAGRDDWWNG